MPTEEEIEAQKRADDEARAKALKTEIHSAVASHLKPIKEALTKELGESLKGILTETLGGLTSELDQRLDAKIAASKAGGEGAGAGSGAGAAKPVTETPEWKGMQKRQADLEREIQASKDREAASRKKSREGALRQRLNEGLLKRGIDGSRVEHALAYVQAKDLAKYASDEDEADITIRDAAGDDVDFDSGLDGWVKSDAFKIYLPPRGAAGSGDRGGGRRPPGTATGKKTEASHEDIGNFVLGLASGGIGLGGGRSG